MLPCATCVEGVGGREKGRGGEVRGAGSSGRVFARDRLWVRAPCGWSRALAVWASCNIAVRARGDFQVVTSTLAAPLDPHARGPSCKRRILEGQQAKITAPWGGVKTETSASEIIAAPSQTGVVEPIITGGEHKRCQGTVTYAPDADAASAQVVLVRAVSGGALGTRVRRRATAEPRPRAFLSSDVQCSSSESAVQCRTQEGPLRGNCAQVGHLCRWVIYAGRLACSAKKS